MAQSRKKKLARKKYEQKLKKQQKQEQIKVCDHHFYLKSTQNNNGIYTNIYECEHCGYKIVD